MDLVSYVFMISPARKLCYRILKGIEAKCLFSDDALNSSEMESLDIRDRHLTTEIVYGTLRWKGLLDYVLEKSCSRPWHQVAQGAQTLLRMSLYQMWRMDRIPPHALVNDAVELAKRDLGKGIDRFLNGVLRNLARNKTWTKDEMIQSAPAWIQVSLPEWLWKRWVGRYGASRAREFALALNNPPRAALRPGRKEGQTGDLPFGIVPSELVPDAYIQDAARCQDGSASDSFARCQFQDEASQLVPHLLGPALQGWRIWDTCAAPGGKSAILDRLCGGAGRVVACDIGMQRILRLRDLLRNAGALKTDIVISDAAKSVPFRCSFDAVLADVPCSGLGTLRRNPEIKWHFEPGRLIALKEIQKQILHNVSQGVRVGGSLLYSTCSTEPEENEEVIADFLSHHPAFSLKRPNNPPGVDLWVGEDHMMRTFPSSRLWDGFFAALLIRHQ